MTLLLHRPNFYCRVSDVKLYKTKDKLDLLVNDISDISNIPINTLKGDTRQREVAIWRQVAQFIAWKQNYGSLKEIARYFNRHHATIIHSRDLINEMIDINDEYTMSKLALLNKFITLAPVKSKQYKYTSDDRY